MPPRRKKGGRGFASIAPEVARRIHRDGGLVVSQDREHMARIGSLGGKARAAAVKARAAKEV